MQSDVLGDKSRRPISIDVHHISPLGDFHTLLSSNELTLLNDGIYVYSIDSHMAVSPKSPTRVTGQGHGRMHGQGYVFPVRIMMMCSGGGLPMSYVVKELCNEDESVN